MSLQAAVSRLYIVYRAVVLACARLSNAIDLNNASVVVSGVMLFQSIRYVMTGLLLLQEWRVLKFFGFGVFVLVSILPFFV